MRFEATSPGGRARTIYLFPRTSREKEYWFKRIYEMIHFARGNREVYTKIAGKYNAYTNKTNLVKKEA